MSIKSIEFVERGSIHDRDPFYSEENARQSKEIMVNSNCLAEEYYASGGSRLLLPPKFLRGPGYIDKNNWGYLHCDRITNGDFDGWAGDGSTSTKVEAAYSPLEYYLPKTRKKAGSVAVALLTGSESSCSLRARKDTFQKQLLADYQSREKWASFASGGGLPFMEALQEAGSVREAVAVDYDPASLRLMAERAKNMGIDDRFIVQHRDLRRNEGGYEHGYLSDKMITALGLQRLPYLKEIPIPLSYFDKIEVSGMVEYLNKNAAAQVVHNTVSHLNKKDGSAIIFSNIWDKHPERQWLDNVPQWTVMKYRSLDEMKDIFERANQFGANIKYAEVFTAGDGYLVFTCRIK
ncbi:MAG: class I SAM-dependent methyltransferase [Candidatus Nomurabacteria bacterium]|jgi:hypothetical protein|nr:class I SAM-dependent methyltransferase [Candidatus Nomurabacteria bacterium]